MQLKRYANNPLQLQRFVVINVKTIQMCNEGFRKQEMFENALKLYELRVQLSIGLLHFISETCKNISVVEGPDKLFSIRSIRSTCQMENSYIRSEKCSFPVDCCIPLERLRKYRRSRSSSYSKI